MTQAPAPHPAARPDPASGRGGAGPPRRPAPDLVGAPLVADLQLRGVAGPLRARVHWPGPPGRDLAPALPVLFPAGLCLRAGIVVLSVFPGPAAAGDAAAALAWAADHAADLDADPRRLLVAGEGAGGGLAAAVAVHARDQGWPPLAAQLLVFPELEDGPAGRLPAAVLAGVAPATVVTAGDDPAAPGGRRHAARLRRAGVEVEELRYRHRGHAAAALLTDLGHVLRQTLAALPRPRGPT